MSKPGVFQEALQVFMVMLRCIQMATMGKAMGFFNDSEKPRCFCHSHSILIHPNEVFWNGSPEHGHLVFQEMVSDLGNHHLQVFVKLWECIKNVKI